MLISPEQIAGLPATPATARERTRAVLRDWRGRGRIVVFGAGAHTQKILPILEEHANLIAGVADDSPASWGRTVGCWSVRAPADAIDEGTGAILVSSDVQQQVIEDQLRRSFGDRCAILTLYEATSDADTGPSLPSTGERQTARTLEEVELGHRARYYWALQHLPAGVKVLDAACGSGYGCRILAEGGARVLGVDVSPDAVAFARHYHGCDGIAFETASIDHGTSLLKIAADFRPFDAVVSMETIEHVEHPEPFLQTAWDLLVPGGRLFCSTPNAEVMPLDEAPFHRQHFTREQMTAILEKAGFGDIQWYGQEGLQILKGRCTQLQRYQLYRACKAT